MNSSFSDTSLPHEEREKRFAAAFAKKVTSFTLPGTPAAGDSSITIPSYKLNFGNDNISERHLDSIPSLDKSVIGTPIMLFPFRAGSILISTRGLSFRKTGGNKGEYLSWLTLSFMAGGDLTEDNATVRSGRDENLIEESISSSVPHAVIGWIVIFCVFLLPSLNYINNMPNGDVLHGEVGRGLATGAAKVLATLYGIILVFAWFASFPALVITTRKIRVARQKSTLRSKPGLQNFIAIGSMKSPRVINIGPTRSAGGIIICIKLGISIFRLQQEKYG